MVMRHPRAVRCCSRAFGPLGAHPGDRGRRHHRRVASCACADGHTGAATTNRLDADGKFAGGRGAQPRGGARRGPRQPGELPRPRPSRRQGRARTPATTPPPPSSTRPTAAAALRDGVRGVRAARGLEAFGIWTAGEVRTALASPEPGRRARGRGDRRPHQGDRARRAGPQRLRHPDRGRGACARRAGHDRRRGGQGHGGRAGRAGARRVPGGARASPPSASCSSSCGRMAFNGLAHAEGRGARCAAGRGRRVAAARINLADSPRALGTPAARVRSRGAEAAAAADPGRGRGTRSCPRPPLAQPARGR